MMEPNEGIVIVSTTRRHLAHAPEARAVLNQLAPPDALLISDYGKPFDKKYRMTNIALMDPAFTRAVEDRPSIPDRNLEDLYYHVIMSIFFLANIDLLLGRAVHAEIGPIVFYYLQPHEHASGFLLAPFDQFQSAESNGNFNCKAFDFTHVYRRPLVDAANTVRWQAIGGNGFEHFVHSGCSLRALLTNHSRNSD